MQLKVDFALQGDRSCGGKRSCGLRGGSGVEMGSDGAPLAVSERRSELYGNAGSAAAGCCRAVGGMGSGRGSRGPPAAGIKAVEMEGKGMEGMHAIDAYLVTPL